MLDMLQYAFMQRAFLSGIVLGVAIPLVGVIVVLKRLSMIGDTLSHASLAGVAGGLIAGVRTRFINVSFIFACALAISIAARTVGALIVSSMMTVPVACALVVARSWRQTCIVSSTVGLISVLAGLTVSYIWGLKPGGTVVLTQVAILVVLVIWRGVRQNARN